MAKKENLNPAAGLFDTLVNKEVKKEISNSQTIPTQMEGITPTQKKIKPTNELLVQKAYYITSKQYRALKLQAAIGNEKDMSAIVRAALDAYLAETLKKVQ